MNGWQALLWGSVGVGTLGIGLPLAYNAGKRIYDDFHERWIAHRQDLLTLEHIATQNKLRDIRAIPPDERGRYPLLYGKGGILRDPNNLRSFTISTVRETWPALEHLDAVTRAVIGGGGWPTSATAERMLPSGAATVDDLQWPDVVTLGELLQSRQPTIRDLIIGARPLAGGGLEAVSAPLHDLMHVLEVGASGWGKSAWLRSFLYQVALASELVEVVAIDVNGSAFNALRGWGRLRWPVARTVTDAIAVLGAVGDEIDRRKGLFEQYPTVEKLDEYNQATGAGLPPWVVAIDEGTNLLNQKGIGEPLRVAVQTARQYGVYILLAGQSAKHSVIDTQTRDQFSTRLCFRTSPTSSRVVLDDRAAGDLHDKGRAVCQMVGRELCELQGPWVSKEDFIAALANGGPKHQMPLVGTVPAPTPAPSGLSADQVQRVIELHEQGQSLNAIQRDVWGYTGGAAYDQVTALLASITTTPGSDTDDLGADVDVSADSSITFCDFCGRSVDDAPAGVTFATCEGCGVAVCDRCAWVRLCPDCQAKRGQQVES